MSNKNTIEELFERFRGDFDLQEPPKGHQARFMRRLNLEEPEAAVKTAWWKPLSIAASFILLIGLGHAAFNSTSPATNLASVSPEMEQTQSFFTSTINKEMETLISFQSPETQAIVDDALVQIHILEEEYRKLELDLAESGNDKRVVYAMINNFQSRIDLLQQVIAKIEEIKNLKTNENEITI